MFMVIRIYKVNAFQIWGCLFVE